MGLLPNSYFYVAAIFCKIYNTKVKYSKHTLYLFLKSLVLCSIILGFYCSSITYMKIMLNGFQEYLSQKGHIKNSYIPYYLKWVESCLAFLNLSDSTFIIADHKKAFLIYLSKNHEDWQVNQADNALRLYNYYISQKLAIPLPSGCVTERYLQNEPTSYGFGAFGIS